MTLARLVHHSISSLLGDPLLSMARKAKLLWLLVTVLTNDYFVHIMITSTLSLITNCRNRTMSLEQFSNLKSK